MSSYLYEVLNWKEDDVNTLEDWMIEYEITSKDVEECFSHGLDKCDINNHFYTVLDIIFLKARDIIEELVGIDITDYDPKIETNYSQSTFDSIFVDYAGFVFDKDIDKINEFLKEIDFLNNKKEN